MKPEEFIIDIKKNTMKSYYLFSGGNKYVIDKYIGFAIKEEKWNTVDAATAYYEASNRNLFGNESKFIICRLDDGDKGKKQLESLKSLHSNRIMLLLSSRQLNDENEIYFSATAGMKEAEDFCSKNSITGFPIKDSTEEFGLYKTMLELNKALILKNANEQYTLDDILPIPEKPGAELKVFDLDFSEFKNFEEYPMSVKIEKDILTMLRIREIADKPVSEISRISGIANEKMIYLFKKYACKYTMEELVELYFYADDLRKWIRSGMREGYFRELLILRLQEIHERRKNAAR